MLYHKYGKCSNVIILAITSILETFNILFDICIKKSISVNIDNYYT